MGERRIGVAVGDDVVRMARPFTTIQARGPEQDHQAVVELVGREKVDRVVVGLPISLDGKLGRQARGVQAFVRGLKAVCPVPVVMWDERLTSVEAERRLREAGASPSRQKEQQDAVAAAILLQSYMDSLQYTSR